MRLIDADELYKDTEKKIKANNEYGRAVVDGEFLDLINDAFTIDDAVEVVRCKDCVFGMKSFITPSYDQKQYMCRKTDSYHTPDFYCSHGVRKKNESEVKNNV